VRPVYRSPSSCRVLALAAFLALAAAPAPAAITIGQGPAIGIDRAGVTWHEEFQDWTLADLRALDDAGLGDARYEFGDGFDDSRDIVAFYSRSEGDYLYFRVDFYDLALGAEVSNLNLYVAMDWAGGGQVFMPDFLDVTTDSPWEACLAVYRDGNTHGSSWKLFDTSFNTPNGDYTGAYFHSQLDAVEFGIRRGMLTNLGWNGSSPIRFQVFTTKDNAETNCAGGGASSDIADAIVDDDRGCSDGVLNGGTMSTDQAGHVWYASIAHGNQSVNQADDIGAHIYDPQSNTNIHGGTGFLRTLDTHRIFRAPLNIHPSGTLTIACNWATRPGGASDPQDGPSFLAEIREFVDADQSSKPGSLIGGVLAEHIMPYFEGPANAASIALAESLNRVVYGVSAAEAPVMHVPERVIRSQSTGLAPLDGHTFEDIVASPYTATYLDEITHLHWWFHPGESCTPDAGYRHKVHKINGVYTFMINDREDQGKFGNHDGGMVMDSRYSLLQKALYGGSSEIVVVFDDWEALAGKSFDPIQGVSVPNENPNQYHRTIRWAANHPWIRITNLDDLLAVALANPGAFVIDHGFRYDLSMQTYEWLKHASEDSYHYWYYNQNAGFGGNEQSFYDLVPVITGPQGDYHARNATPANDGPPLPSGMKHGDLNSPNTLMYEAWNALQTAPPSRIRDLGIASFLTMIYETAWHEEDMPDYANDCYGPWQHPDVTWDGVNTWALRLQNHVRGAGLYAAAARWVDSVRAVKISAPTRAYTADLDFDGEAEYVVRNRLAFAVFERYGGRCVLAAAFARREGDAQILVGAPFTNPSAPGEEEYTGPNANRCSAFKDMNDGVYADAVYAATRLATGWTFTAPGGVIVKQITMPDDSGFLDVSYTETLPGPLYVRVGLSPNPMDLAFHGHAHLVQYNGPMPIEGPAGSSGEWPWTYYLHNTQGGTAEVVYLPSEVTVVTNPAHAGYNRRNLALTDEVELTGDGAFDFTVRMVNSLNVDAPEPVAGGTLALAGPYPSPGRGSATLALALPRAAPVRWELVDLAGRRVAGADLGPREAGAVEWTIARGALAPGLYFVRVTAGAQSITRRWVVID
jgi:hypothetical protein